MIYTYNDVEEIVADMIDKCDGNISSVTLVTTYDRVQEVLGELLSYEDTELQFINIDNVEYMSEYTVTIDNKYGVWVEPAFAEDDDGDYRCYNIIDDIVMFDVNADSDIRTHIKSDEIMDVEF